MSLYGVINLVFNIINILIIIRVIISWLAPYSRNEFVDFIYRVTEPMLAPFRSLIPIKNLNIDLSPVILYFVLALIRKVILIILY